MEQRELQGVQAGSVGRQLSASVTWSQQAGTVLSRVRSASPQDLLFLPQHSPGMAWSGSWLGLVHCSLGKKASG